MGNWPPLSSRLSTDDEISKKCIFFIKKSVKGISHSSSALSVSVRKLSRLQRIESNLKTVHGKGETHH